MENKTDVKIRLKKLNIINANSNTSVTLKDISTILYQGCGQGVTFNLAQELSAIFDIEPKLMLYALDIITEKYVEMSDQEALNIFLESNKYFPPNAFHGNTQRKKGALGLALHKIIK